MQQLVAYENAQKRAVTAYSQDVRVFDKTFRASVGTSTMRFPSLGGMITSDTMLQTLNMATENSDILAKEMEEHIQCLRGKIAECDLKRITIPWIALVPKENDMTNTAQEVFTLVIDTERQLGRHLLYELVREKIEV